MRPRAKTHPSAISLELGTSGTSPAIDETVALRSLIQKFPYWVKGRALLAEKSLRSDDIATAYAESQALLTLTPQRSKHRVTALLTLGRCFLKRGDGIAALTILNEAQSLRPHDYRIQEERAAAYVLQGEKDKAHAILKNIPTTRLSPEGKAASQWLGSV